MFKVIILMKVKIMLNKKFKLWQNTKTAFKVLIPYHLLKFFIWLKKKLINGNFKYLKEFYYIIGIDMSKLMHLMLEIVFKIKGDEEG